MLIKTSVLKSRLRVFLALLLYVFTRSLPAAILPNVKGKTRVLVFHHVDDVRRFQAIVSTLVKNYCVIDFSRYLAGDTAKDRLNIIIALDDGYLSWYENALPVFGTYNVRPLLFVSSDFLGLSPADAEEFCRLSIRTWPEPSLSWEALRSLSKFGAEIGGHALGHHDLTALENDDQLLRVIAEDHANIERELGGVVRSFAYPFGRCDAAAVKAVEEAGYSFAFTSDSGYLEDSRGPFLLKRTNIGLRSPLAVRAAAEGWLDAVSFVARVIKGKARK